jgi:hypothetical protein
MYQYFKETLEEAIRNSHSNDRAKYNFKKELQNILGQQYHKSLRFFEQKLAK